MTNKIYTNRKTLEKVELVSVTEAGRYIVINAEGAQKSYSESSFKKLFKLEATASEKPHEKDSNKEEPKPKKEASSKEEPSKKASSVKPLTAEEQEKILDKIKKLFALAGNNSSEAEASAAMRKAQELMAKYSISMSETSGVKYEYVALPCKHYHNVGFRLPLSVIVSKSFRCKPILRGNIVYMFGRKEDAQAAVESFNFCYSWIHKQGNALVIKAREQTGTGKGVFNSYVVGVLKGITMSLEEGCTTLAIVVPEDVKNKFDETYSNCKAVKRGMRVSDGIDYEIYKKGVSDGKTLMNKRTIEVKL